MQVVGNNASMGNDDAIIITLADGSRVTASHLLVATGRAPSSGERDLETAIIRTDRGAIVTDRRLRTS